jgi:hypothetical protein
MTFDEIVRSMEATLIACQSLQLDEPLSLTRVRL